MNMLILLEKPWRSAARMTIALPTKFTPLLPMTCHENLRSAEFLSSHWRQPVLAWDWKAEGASVGVRIDKIAERSVESVNASWCCTIASGIELLVDFRNIPILHHIYRIDEYYMVANTKQLFSDYLSILTPTGGVETTFRLVGSVLK